MHLARGHVLQVVPANHLSNALQVIVDDDGKVVGRNPVVSNQHDVIHPGIPGFLAHPKSDRGRANFGPLSAFSIGQSSASSGI